MIQTRIADSLLLRLPSSASRPTQRFGLSRQFLLC